MSTGDDAPLVATRGLVVRDGTSLLLDGIDLNVLPGESLAVIGHNGSGKTTLLRALLRWAQPTQGEICIATGTRLGAMVGEPAFVSWMTPSSFGRMLLDSTGEGDHGRVDDVLERVGLGGRASRRRFRVLSQGQRALAGIAYALLSDPQLLLLDEPFAHLDRRNSATISTLLRERRSAGTAIIYTCHATADLAAADRVITLEEGRHVGEKRPDDHTLDAELR